MKTSTSDSISTISDQDIKPIMRSTRALFVAILSRALKDIFKPTCDDYDLCRRQALHWIEVNDPESFTSFVNICNYLDIDADRVRRIVILKTVENACN
ncbi:uncharacterized protein Dvar_70710 [Desulfosarcina variabilis str. Montpellier]